MCLVFLQHGAAGAGGGECDGGEGRGVWRGTYFPPSERKAAQHSQTPGPDLHSLFPAHLCVCSSVLVVLIVLLVVLIVLLVYSFAVVQVMFHRMKHASKLAAEHKWEVVQEMPHPLLSSSIPPAPPTSHLLGPTPHQQGSGYSETTSLLLESSDSQGRLELLFNWNGLTATKSSLRPDPVPSPAALSSQGVVGVATSLQVDIDKWESRTITFPPHGGDLRNFREHYLSLLSST